MKTLKQLLQEGEACEPSIEWVGDKTIEQALQTSTRGDWVLWLAAKLQLPLKEITLAKARCAKTVIHLMKDQRSIDAVNVAERFGLGLATLEELNTAADTAAYAADAAAYAADTAAYAADTAAAAYAARKTSLQLTSDICVGILGELIINEVNQLLCEKN
jgi:hypothetical protein